MPEASNQLGLPTSILQLRHGAPDISASAATYAEAVARQGLPETHSQLLRDLKAWVATAPETGHSALEALRRVVEVEGDETGCDRLEAVYAMENVTLQRLQERQERLELLVESLIGEESEPPP
jgi:hypothetical protein